MVASFVATVGSSFLFPLHVSILWLFRPQFVQCLLISHVFDALPSHGVKPTLGFHKVKLRKVELGSTLPASNSRKG